VNIAEPRKVLLGRPPQIITKIDIQSGLHVDWEAFSWTFQPVPKNYGERLASIVLVNPRLVSN